MIDCVISTCANKINYKLNLSRETYLRTCFVFQIVEAVIYYWCWCLHGLLSSLVRVLSILGLCCVLLASI